ncbi:putative serine/threonine-protein kinase mps1-like protein [Dinothrombium tinctorium]|uniref:Putative serine/threonine-protein kinase mps1-like protein n=1 Tax=Dinothrombium tinctorium TaxID=1965070 RepID=A0A443R0G4_9ACAR|nr:putative serine/threonine-protein kinase mps1-like protein [Dinothrombium tinctorium]
MLRNALAANGCIQKRFAKKKAKTGNKRAEESSDEESEEEIDEELEVVKDYKDIEVEMDSIRLDSVVKRALGLTRHNVESAFYESRIYYNGEKLEKKSVDLNEDDEVDLILGRNQENNDLLDVSRIVIRKIRLSDQKETLFAIKIRRFKRLIVENYENPWRGTLINQ